MAYKADIRISMKSNWLNIFYLSTKKKHKGKLWTLIVIYQKVKAEQNEISNKKIEFNWEKVLLAKQKQQKIKKT